VAANGAPVEPQVVAEHDRLAVHHRHQTRAGPQQGGLAGAVGPLQQDDLAGLDVEVDAGQSWEPSEQGHSTAKVDGRLHDDAETIPAALIPPPMLPRCLARSPTTYAFQYMLARWLGRLGRTLIAAGVLVFLFLGYLLWGTNLQTAASQDKLEKQYGQQVAEAKQKLAKATPVKESPTTTAPTPTGPPSDNPVAVPLPSPAEGDIVGRIGIAKIGLKPKVIVESVTEEQLKRGPGHYPGTALPGQKGNVAIAGHRTTYGAPFHDVNQLNNGDEITVTTTYGNFVYVVSDKKIVDPSDTSVLENHGEALLTLTACHPIWSAQQRLIIIAKLKGAPVGKLTGQDEANKKLAGGLAGEKGLNNRALSSLDSPHPAKGAVVMWGLLAAAIWLVAWIIARFVLGRRVRWYISWIPYAVGLPLFGVALYVFFENFVRQLPSNF